jgi:hypothetical protein
MTSKFTRIAIATAVAGAMALPAGGAMAGTSKTESALLGGLLGAVAGGAIGHGKTNGVLLGAAAGAALGVAVDSSNDRNHSYRSGRSYRDSRRYSAPRYASQYAPRNDGRYYEQTQSRYDYGYDSYGYRR